MAKEIWDIYDAHKQVTNDKVVRGEKLEKGQYHLVIHVCFFNHLNQLLIQKRSLYKNGWPGMWDISVGGAVRSGETSSEAATRESLEEIGIHHDFSNQLPQISLSFERGFDDIFLVTKDFDIKEVSFNDDEVCDAKWASKEEISELIQKGEFVPIHTIEFIEYIFQLKN